MNRKHTAALLFNPAHPRSPSAYSHKV